MRPWALILAFALVTTQLSSLRAGETAAPDTPTTFRSRVRVVNVPATVRDKHGRIINSLTKDDFVLEEDGKQQVIKYFSHDTNLPLTLGLLVDTSLSQINVLSDERRASFAFLDRMLRPDKDNAFIIHFDFEVELLQDFTSSREKLRSALDNIQPPSVQVMRRATETEPGSPGGGGRRQHQHRGGGTLLYDSIYLAGDELMTKQQGRKALILLTDGDDRGSRETLEQAVAAAQRADTIVYSILYADENGPGGWRGYPGGGRGGVWDRHPHPMPIGNDGKKVLEKISNETGGRMFKVSKKEPIEKIYGEIEEELRNLYSLGYTPTRLASAADANVADTAPHENAATRTSDRSAANHSDRKNSEEASAELSGYHKIRLTTKNKDLRVQARAGYYGEP